MDEQKQSVRVSEGGDQGNKGGEDENLKKLNKDI
jgi:hypothetical protein